MDYSDLAAAKKIVFQKIGVLLVVSAALYLLSGCGKESVGSADPAGPTQEVNIQYHADDDEWTYDREAIIIEPEEDAEKAEEKEKTIITLANSCPPEYNPLQHAVAAFNKENDQYHVELQSIEIGTTMADGRLRLQTEVGAGGGPDIMTPDVFHVDQEMLDQGVLVDLTPYLQASGITEEKYFPGYACLQSEGKTFGISFGQSVDGMAVDRRVLGSDEAPEDIGTLVDKLLEYPERACFENTTQGGRWILRYFICGSEDLWGMIDWEARSCDFSGELFSKMLEVTKRYLQDAQSGYEQPVMSWLTYASGAYEGGETLKRQGKVAVDYYFDEGHFPRVNNDTSILFINANTEHLDGAWAFLSFIMTKRGQNYIPNPLHRELYDEMVQKELELIDEGRMETLYPFTEEISEEIVEAYDRARALPMRTEAIQEIIYEEAESYFSGDKSKEEVIDIIQNRVQLYLNEG